MLSGSRRKDTTISSATASIEISEGARQASLVEYRHSSVTLHCVTGAQARDAQRRDFSDWRELMASIGTVGQCLLRWRWSSRGDIVRTSKRLWSLVEFGQQQGNLSSRRERSQPCRRTRRRPSRQDRSSDFTHESRCFSRPSARSEVQTADLGTGERLVHSDRACPISDIRDLS